MDSGMSSEPVSVFFRILLIDDEPDVSEVLTLALERKGYIVEQASDGQQGLVLMLLQPPDLILCDLHMPGMSGEELYRRVKSDHPALARRILFTTGDTIRARTRDFLEENHVPYLCKPFELKQLLSEVEKVLKALSLP